MTKLLQHIDEVSTSLSQTFTSEQSLVKSLDDALYDLDQRLLREVRKVATEHQARRGAIRKELRALAGSIGMFRPQHETHCRNQPSHRRQPPPYHRWSDNQFLSKSTTGSNMTAINTRSLPATGAKRQRTFRPS